MAHGFRPDAEVLLDPSRATQEGLRVALLWPAGDVVKSCFSHLGECLVDEGIEVAWRKPAGKQALHPVKEPEAQALLVEEAALEDGARLSFISPHLDAPAKECSRRLGQAQLAPPPIEIVNPPGPAPVRVLEQLPLPISRVLQKKTESRRPIQFPSKSGKRHAVDEPVEVKALAEKARHFPLLEAVELVNELVQAHQIAFLPNLLAVRGPVRGQQIAARFPRKEAHAVKPGALAKAAIQRLDLEVNALEASVDEEGHGLNIGGSEPEGGRHIHGEPFPQERRVPSFRAQEEGLSALGERVGPFVIDQEVKAFFPLPAGGARVVGHAHVIDRVQIVKLPWRFDRGVLADRDAPQLLFREPDVVDLQPKVPRRSRGGAGKLGKWTLSAPRVVSAHLVKVLASFDGVRIKKERGRHGRGGEGLKGTVRRFAPKDPIANDTRRFDALPAKHVLPWTARGLKARRPGEARLGPGLPPLEDSKARKAGRPFGRLGNES